MDKTEKKDISKARNQSTSEKNNFLGFFIRYYGGFYLLLLLQFLFLFAFNMKISSLNSFTFTLCTSLTYPFIYMLPGVAALLSVFTLFSLLKIKVKYSHRILYLFMIMMSGITITLLFIDYKIYSMFSFHINSFVLNLIFTPGGIESMGASNIDIIMFIFLFILNCFIPLILLFTVIKFSKRFRVHLKRELIWASSIIFILILIGFFGEIEYAYSNYKNNAQVYYNSKQAPFYIPLRMAKIFHSFGIKKIKRDGMILHSKNSMLHYPLKPLSIVEKNKKYNIVWLVSESWRADTLTKEIMPSTLNFADKCLVFHNHYSAGNGTRMALFGMFYGLYGSYWKAALFEHTTPVIMEVLKKDNYQFDMYTSAKFTYPEFDQTIFNNIESKSLHQSDGRGGFVNDRNNITSMLSFIKQRDRNRPFMTFMFFESPHAPYTFPDECIIKKDFLPTFNYSTVDIEANITQIKNRYLNSVNHLDTQLARVFDFLEKEKLLDSTIIIVAGDHGEEFLEKGHWGHNKGFHEEEIRTPLLIHIPDKKHEDIYSMSSHLDIPATIAPFLGLENKPEEYSLGYNLLKQHNRKYTACSSWNELCYIDNKFKDVIEPMGYNTMSSVNDAPVTGGDQKLFNKTQLLEMMRNANIFYVK